MPIRDKDVQLQMWDAENITLGRMDGHLKGCYGAMNEAGI